MAAFIVIIPILSGIAPEAGLLLAVLGEVVATAVDHLPAGHRNAVGIIIIPGAVDFLPSCQRQRGNRCIRFVRGLLFGCGTVGGKIFRDFHSDGFGVAIDVCADGKRNGQVGSSGAGQNQRTVRTYGKDSLIGRGKRNACKKLCGKVAEDSHRISL